MDANLEFSRATGIPIALDESLDDAFPSTRAGTAVLRSLLPESGPAPGVAAVVVKPAVMGGFEASSTVASWARNLGMQVKSLTLHATDLVWENTTQALLILSPCPGRVDKHDRIRVHCMGAEKMDSFLIKKVGSHAKA